MSSAANYTLHKEEYGTGEPILMLHGWAMHTGVWRMFAQCLAANHKVICMDLPGHGLSASLSPYTLESIVDAIDLALPEQAVTLIGWSLGGNIAMRLAEKYPQRIKSLVLIACNPHFIKTATWPGVDIQILNEFVEHLNQQGAATLLRFMSLQVQGRPDMTSNLRRIKAAVQECPAPESETLMQGLAILQGVDQRLTLQNLALPVLMLLGKQDTLVPVSVGQQSQLLQPQMELHIITDAGHVPFITDQQRVLSLLHDFIARVDLHD